MFRDRDWEERNVMVDLGEPFEAARKSQVVYHIRTVEEFRIMDKLGLGSNLLGRLAGDIGLCILSFLPKKVCKFTYSETLPDVTAIRETGTESWDAKRALDWGLEDVDQDKAGRTKGEIGEIS